MAPRKKSVSSVSVSSVNANYNDLMRTAHEENRNGNPYNNSYTFTARGSQKVASKARKFINAALLIGGAAGLAYFFRGQIGEQMKPILESLDGKYKNLKLNVLTKYKAAKLNAMSNKPGFAGRTMQGWQSTSRGIGRARNGIGGAYDRARNGVASTYGKATRGAASTYGKTRNGIGEAYGVVRGLTTRPRTVSSAPRLSPPSLKSKTAKFDNALHDLVGHKLYEQSVANARKAFLSRPAGRTSHAAFANEVRETLHNKLINAY